MRIVRESYIRKLIRLVEESDIDSLEVSSWGRRVKITHSNNSSSNGSGLKPGAVAAIVKTSPELVQPVKAETPAEVPAAAKIISNLRPIKSPMVGTFYAISGNYNVIFYSYTTPASDIYSRLNSNYLVDSQNIIRLRR